MFRSVGVILMIYEIQQAESVNATMQVLSPVEIDAVSGGNVCAAAPGYCGAVIAAIFAPAGIGWDDCNLMP